MTIAAAKKKTIHYGILWTLLALILSLQVSYGTAFPEVQAAFEIDDVDAYDGSLRPRFLFNLSEEQLKLNPISGRVRSWYLFFASNDA